MSHGAHRAPKPKTRRLRRIAATLGFAAAAAGISLAADAVVTPQADSGWGAPDTAGVTVATEAGVGVDLSTGVNVPLGDSGWG